VPALARAEHLCSFDTSERLVVGRIEVTPVTAAPACEGIANEASVRLGPRLSGGLLELLLQSDYLASHISDRLVRARMYL